MRNGRAKRRIFCAFLLAAAIAAAAAAATIRAQSVPDFSKLDPSCLLPEGRQHFSRPGGGYVLISTDARAESMVTLTSEDGRADERLGRAAYAVPFVYRCAAVSGNFLFLAGGNPEEDGVVRLFRFSLQDAARVLNRISNVSCDFSHGLRSAEDGAAVSLVTLPYGQEPGGGTPFRTYRFDPSRSDAEAAEVEDAVSSAHSASESGSGAPPESAVSPGTESPPSDPLSPQSTGWSDVPLQPEPFRFEAMVTVEDLRAQLAAQQRPVELRVAAADGTVLESGPVGTGALIEVMSGGVPESRVRAVISGDLTGEGTVTEGDSQALYDHLLHREPLSGFFLTAADLDRDGDVDTSDALLLKTKIQENFN